MLRLIKFPEAGDFCSSPRSQVQIPNLKDTTWFLTKETLCTGLTIAPMGACPKSVLISLWAITRWRWSDVFHPGIVSWRDCPSGHGRSPEPSQEQVFLFHTWSPGRPYSLADCGRRNGKSSWAAMEWKQAWEGCPACCVQDEHKAHPRRCLRTLGGGCRKPKQSLCPTQYTCACAKSLPSCTTLCNPMDFSPPGSSVHGISQAQILE